jgi:hypothetical protein
MTNAFFLNWIAARIVHVYGESEHVDFVTKLRGMPLTLRKLVR